MVNPYWFGSFRTNLGELAGCYKEKRVSTCESVCSSPEYPLESAHSQRIHEVHCCAQSLKDLQWIQTCVLRPYCAEMNTQRVIVFSWCEIRIKMLRMLDSSLWRLCWILSALLTVTQRILQMHIVRFRNIRTRIWHLLFWLFIKTYSICSYVSDVDSQCRDFNLDFSCPHSLRIWGVRASQYVELHFSRADL